MNLLWKLLFILLGFTSCTKEKVYYEESGSVFKTLYHLKYESSELLTEKIDAELQNFNLSLNPFNPNSIISKVNRNEDVEVDEWFAYVLDKSREVSEASDGAFDITCAPLVNAWGFGFSKIDSITPQLIDSIRTFVGYEKITLKGRKLIKTDPRTIINASSIAKGYAADVLAKLFEEEGVGNYMIEIGGEIVAKGKNSSGRCWRIGINEPEDEQNGTSNKVGQIVQLCEKKGLATSGDYRNFYIKNNRKYAHTINPKTGYPAGQDILSATIIADDCITADAYATAFMAMGKEKSIEMAKNLPNIAYYIIYTNNDNGEIQTYYSDNMKQYLIK